MCDKGMNLSGASPGISNNDTALSGADSLNGLFSEAEIVPDEKARQKAKARMLSYEENPKKYFFRRFIMNTQEDTKKKFKFTNQHLQGAVAMLLVFVIALSALTLTPGLNLFGTVFAGYEDAQEQPMTIEPGAIEAVKDYAGETFVLTGLPESDLSGIRKEHVFTGGYFENLTVQNVEAKDGALLVTLVQGEPAENSDEADWEGYAGTDGLIAVSPEALKDKSFYYQGVVTVEYPEISSETEAIARDGDGNISQTVTLTLENDSLTGTLAPEDLKVTGLDSFSIDGFNASGNSISFTLKGKTKEFDNVQVILSGEKLKKGIDVTFTAGIGRVPMPLQNSPLAIGVDSQTLEIFMDYDTFAEDVSLSMLTFGGIMNEVEVLSLERLDYKNIKLELKGSLKKAGTGTIRFDSAAVESGKHGRVCKVTVCDPNQPAPQSSPQASNMSASPVNPPTIMPLMYNSTDALQIKPMVGEALVAAIGKKVATAIVKAVAKAGIKITVKEISNYVGVTPPKNEKDLIKEVLKKMDDLESEAEANQKELMARFDKLDYGVTAEMVGTDYDQIRKVYENYNTKVNGLSESALETWYKDNMIYPVKTSNGSDYFQTLSILIDRLDPYYKDPTGRESLIIKFERQCKSALPFEHNIYMAMEDYAANWDSDIAQFLTLAGDMLDYNYGEISDGKYADMQLTVKALSDHYLQVFSNIESYINNQSYTRAYSKLIVPSNQTAMKRPNKLYYLVTNDNGCSYLLMDTYNYYKDYDYNCPPSPNARNGKSIVHGKKASNSTVNEFELNAYDAWYCTANRPGKFESKKTIGDPEKFRQSMRAFNQINKKPATLNDIFKNYLVTSEDKKLWFFDSGQECRYLYQAWCPSGVVGGDLLGKDNGDFYDMKSTTFWAGTVSCSSKDLYNLENKKGFGSKDYIAVLLVFERN